MFSIRIFSLPPPPHPPPYFLRQPHTAQDDLELLILLPPPLECFDYRREPPHLVYEGVGTKPSMLARQAFYRQRYTANPFFSGTMK